MPEMRDPEKGTKENEKRHFITEKVVKPSLTRGQIARRILVLLLAAVIFGAVAAVSFAVTKPYADRLAGGTEVVEPSVSIPKDEPAEASAAAEAPTETAAETESEPIEEKVQLALENYRYTMDDVNSLLANLRAQAQTAAKGIVVVHSVQQEVDWFDNPVETTGVYAGVVIADTSQELLILTPEAAASQADSIKVTFGDGKDVDARMKQKDTISGMAIVSGNVEELDEATLKSVEVMPLGNSYAVREGDLIAAVGGPAGIVSSVDYGFVSYVLKNAQMVDSQCRVLYSDILADVDKGTFFINTSGELIGWAMKPLPGDGEGRSGVTQIMGVSDYKGILERLSNGLGAPCVGIVGQELSEAMAARGMPKGIYVVNAVTDGPAYNAGIQNGDIITAIDNTKMTTMKDYLGKMDDLECGQLIHVTLERNGRDQYTQLEFQVTVGAR